MTRISTKKATTLALLTGAVFTISSLAPVEFAPSPFSPDAAFAKSEKANGGNKGGNSGNRGGGKSGDKGGKGGGKSADKGGGGKGFGKAVGGMFANVGKKGGNLIDGVFGRDKAKAKAQKVKTQNAAAPKGKPNAVVRQYVLAKPELSQGEVASMLKSWNSLNRNEQAYLNNMDNPNSLPGKQIEYVRSSLAAQDAVMNFETLGGDLLNPPTDVDLAEATAVLDAATALDAAAFAAGFTDYAGYEAAVLTDPILADPTIDAMAAPDASALTAAQAVVDQYDAYYGEGGVVETEGAAQDAFMEASVSYSGEYDESMAEVREHVDAIIDMKELDTLVSDYDAAAAEVEAEAAAAEGEPVVTDDVVLLDGNGETFTLAVE